MNVHVRRIANKFEDLFSGLINMDDVKNESSEKKKAAFVSRSLAAYAITMETGAELSVAANSVVDGYKDCGIDAIYCDNFSKKLYLVQSKWSDNGNSSISQGDLLKTIQGVEKLLNLDFSGVSKRFATKLPEIEKAINQMDYQIQLIVIYTSNQPLSEECQAAIDGFLKRINDDISEMILFKTLTLNQIYDCLSSSTRTQDINVDDVLLNNWGRIESGSKTAYYGMINASAIAEWWQKYGNLLLDKNIRYFKGDTSVNKGMVDTLIECPEKFPYFNNGVKVIAKNIVRKLAHSTDRKTGLFCINGISIVNGAQTVGCIGQAFSKNPEKVSTASVMIEIISLEGAEEKFGEEITKLSNTQNRIESKAFVTIDPWHGNMQKDLIMDGYEYAYKDGQISSKSVNSCSFDEVAVAVGCNRGDITLVATIKRAYGSIFEDINKPPYKTIFNNSVNAYEVWNCVSILRLFEAENSKYQKNVNNIQKLISIHGNRFILHMVFESIKQKDIALNEQYLSFDEKFKEQMRDIISNYIDEIILAKQSIYPDAYPANLFKNAKRCRDIKESIKLIGWE